GRRQRGTGACAPPSPRAIWRWRWRGCANEQPARSQWPPTLLAASPLQSGAPDRRVAGGGMTRERLYLFDTTLRDGAQTTGVDFSLEDKRLIARTLDELGLDYIEGGYPGANVTDTAFFSTDPGLSHAIFTAFGMTKRAGRSASNDPGLKATLQANAGA